MSVGVECMSRSLNYDLVTNTYGLMDRMQRSHKKTADNASSQPCAAYMIKRYDGQLRRGRSW